MRELDHIPPTLMMRPFQTVSMKDGFPGSCGLGLFWLLRNIGPSAVICAWHALPPYLSNTARPNAGSQYLQSIYYISSYPVRSF